MTSNTKHICTDSCIPWCPEWPVPPSNTRTFATGATRDNDSQKLDYEGFLSPIVLERFAQYMHECRLRNIPEGMTIRQSDNWQKGMSKDSFMKSGLRHMIELWLMHDGYEAKDDKGKVLDIEEVLCAIIFNVQGYLYEILKEKHERYSNRGAVRRSQRDPSEMPRLQDESSLDPQI